VRGLEAKDYIIIHDPKPTQETKTILELELIKEISGDLDETHFLAAPINIAVDGDGNIYVHDRKLVKIFKLDRNYNYVKTFANGGRGPGEISPNDIGLNNMYLAADGNLYFHSRFNRKIIIFDKEGKLVREIRLPQELNIPAFCPVADAKGNLYIRSTNSGAVDRFDSMLRQRHTFLTHKEYKKFIIIEPFRSIVNDMLYPEDTNTFYDVLPGNRLLIYIDNSSSVYLFQCDKLVHKFNAWPSRGIYGYKKIKEEIWEREKKNPSAKNYHINFSWSFFVDKDDQQSFYIDPVGFKNKRSLFKYDKNGNLMAIYTYERNHGRIKAKRNNIFYGIDRVNGAINLYKEKK
jgi:hypothetical protein